jgi:competence protein ComEA
MPEPPPSPAPPLPPVPPPPPPAAAPSGGSIDLNSVSFEQLRAENLSVTQATRLLAHRERLGRFSSVDELDEVAGLPQDLLEDLKRRSTV